MSYGLPEGDEGAGQVKKGEVVSADSLPANEQSTEAVVPSIGTLDHPAARLALYPAKQRLLAASSDVRPDSASSNSSLGVGVVVAFVEAEVRRPPRAARRAHDHGVERLGDEPLVVDVGTGDLGGQWDAATVRQDVAFDATFRAVRRIRTREVPPFGAFTMALSSEDHFHWMPRLRS